jgi:putative (di)nucleoside polyphosphate hydrolase
VAARGRHKAEFEAWRWVAAGQLAGLIVAFKRQVYADVVREFAAWLR